MIQQMKEGSVALPTEILAERLPKEAPFAV